MLIRSFVVVPLLGLLATARAASLTWDADPAAAGVQDGAGAWDAVATNWWDGLANTNWSDAAPDAALIGATNGAAGTIAVSGARALSGLTFNTPGSGAYLLSGGALDLAGSPVITANADAQIDTSLTGGSLTKAGVASLKLGGTGSYTGSTLVVAGTLEIVGGAVTGTAGLITRSGGAAVLTNGTIALSASSAGVFGVGYGAAGMGTVTVRAGGVLSVGNGGGRTFIGGGPPGGPFGIGVVNVEGGELRVGPSGVNPNDYIYFNGYGGTGTSVLNLAGGAFVTARPLSMGSAPSGVLNWNGGILRAATNSANLVAVTAVNVLGGGAIFDDGGFTVTIGSALLHGAGGPDGGLTKLGAGTLILTAQHTYQGPTLVSNGVLTLAGGSAVPLLPASNTLVVGGGATLRFGRHDAFGIHTTTSSPSIVVSAGGVMASAGTFTTIWNPTLNGGSIQANGGANALFPAFQLAGTLTVGGSQASSITAATNAFSAICLGGLSNSTLVVSVADATGDPAPDLNIGAPMQNNQASLTGALQKAGSGTLVLAATNSYTGATLVQGGTLRLAAGAALLNAGSIGSVSGAVLEVAGTITQAANKYFATGSGLSGSSGTTIVLPGAVLNLGGNAVVIGGALNNGAQYGVGAMIVSGGVVNVGAGVSGAGIDVANVWINPYGSSSTSTLQLAGGVFSTARSINDGGNGRSRVNFDGGTLRAAATHANFLAVTKAELLAGGGILDTQGFTVTVFQAFSGVGALTKRGGGTLVLAGTSSHTGTTTVDEGTLALARVDALSPASALVIGNGTTLSAGTNRQTVSALSLGTSATDAVTVVVTGDGVGLPGFLTISNPGGLSITGAVTIRLVGSLPPVGVTNVLFTYAGAASGTEYLSVAPPGPRVQILVTNNTAAGRVELIVTDLGQLRWVGNLTNGWDLSGATNWVLSNLGAPTGFTNGDYAIFDDAASNVVVAAAELVQPGTMAVSGTNSFTFQGAAVACSGGLQITGTGTTHIQNALSCASGAFSNGLVVVGDGGTNGTLASSGGVINDGALLFDRADSVTSSLRVAGSGSMTKRGAGTMTLVNNLSSFTGTASMLEGIVVAGGGGLGANPTTSVLGNPQVPGRDIIVSTNTLLSFVQHDQLGNAASTPQTRVVARGGTLATDGHLVILGPVLLENAAVVASNSAGFGYGFEFNGTVSAAPGATSLVTAVGGAGFYLNNAVSRTTTFDVGADGLLRLAAPVRNNWAAQPSILLKTGAGRLELTSTNVHSGGTILQGGVLAIESDAALGSAPLTMNGGVFATAGGARTLFNTVNLLADAVVDTSGGDLILNGALTNAAGLIKVGGGKLILHAANSYVGATTVSNGALLVNGTTGAGAVTIDAGATLGGTGLVKGVVAQNGILSPGVGIGLLTISNQVSCGGASVTRFELGGTNSYDQLVVSDLHILNGTLEVVTTNGYVPVSGDRFNLITNTALGGLLFGPFPSTSLPALPVGMGWEVQYSASDAVSLVVTGSVVSLTAYEQWAAQIPNPSDRSDQMDPDNDGYANLLEYSQGSDPTNNANNAKLNLVRTNGMEVIVFNRVNTATDIVYEVQASYAPTNNAEWQGLATNSVGSWGSSTNVNDDNTATIHRVWVSDLILGTNRSLRLKVTRP